MTTIFKIPDVSKQIYENEIHKCLEEKWHDIGYEWMSHQLDYINDVYKAFNDHLKFLIIIYLINKTLSFYAISYVMLSYDKYYEQKSIEIEKFNVIEISEQLNLPKETARRKIKELEDDGIIKRDKKKLIIDKTAFPFVQPIKSIPRISRFINKFSKTLAQKKQIDKIISSEEIEKKIKLNFTYIWKNYYELQIDMIKGWNFHFGDTATWHIFGTCAVAQGYSVSKTDFEDKSRETFNVLLTKGKYFMGINAMSISELTGIPRATVVRKLNTLVKSDHLVINKKKQYFVSEKKIEKLTKIQSKTIKNLSTFITKTLNMIII
tara:strand:- start:63 stop:1025 length:963 start_codon:yes stop_codon:yes gene_type:complete